MPHTPDHQLPGEVQVQRQALQDIVQTMAERQQLAGQAPTQMPDATRQQQLNAGLAGLVQLLNPNAQSPLAGGLATGLQALQQQRAQSLQGLQQRHQQRTEALSERIRGLSDVAGIAGQLESGRLGREKFQFQQEQRDRLDLVDNTGRVLGEVLEGPQGRLFDVDPSTGQFRDITAQVAQQGLRTKPKSSQTINVDARPAGEDFSALVDKQSIQRLDKLREQEAKGRDKVVTAERLIELAPQVTSGAGAQLITDFKSLASTGLREVGLESIAKRIETADAETMQGLSGQAMMPFIEAQGRSFSDQDRKATERMIAGVKNTPKANLALGNLMKAAGLAEQEEFYFNEEVVRRRAAGERKDTFGASREFSQYVNDVPRLKVSAEGVPVAVTSGRDLWKYWVGGRPKKFVIQGQNGTAEMTQEQLRKEAEQRGLSYRELLGGLDQQGVLLGAQR